jgi:anthranilate phosphoribosyltransferase
MQQAIKKVLARQDLTADEMVAVMRNIMTGNATPAQICGFLVGLLVSKSYNEEPAVIN